MERRTHGCQMTKRDTDLLDAVTAEQLAEWKALAESATDGPWLYRPREDDDWGFVRGGNEQWTVAIGRAAQHLDEDAYGKHRAGGTDPYGHNAKFIAAARTAVSALIDEVERLREALKQAAAHLEMAAAALDKAGQRASAASARSDAIEARVALSDEPAK